MSQYVDAMVMIMKIKEKQGRFFCDTKQNMK